MAESEPGAPLRLLIIEDRADDAALMLRELRRAGLQPRAVIVADESELLAHLSPPPELILADYSLPAFGALRALELLREREIDVPVVVVSGSISEEIAVECMVHGAVDYVLKDRPARLGQAAIRAIGEAQLRRDKRQAEESLRRSEERFRRLAENAQDIIFRYRLYPDPAFEYVSPAATAAIGYTPEEHYADPLLAQKIVHPDDAPLYSRLPSLPRHAGQPVVFRWMHKDGHVVWIEQTSVPICDDSGRVVAIEGVSRDVSQRHLAEEALRLSEGIAHDFNNLLTAITGYATFAKSSLAAEDPSGAGLEEVLKAAERAANLTGQLLAFARNRSAEMQLLDANELIRNTDRMLRRLIRADIELVTLPADSLWPLEADRGQLEQVLINLVINARDAMPSGGKLTIETRNTWLQRPSPDRRLNAPPGEYVVLSVSDTGHGISREASQHLFEPFFTTKEAGQGTGLGLAVVYSVVQQHRGDISVRSEVGHGSTFEVYLPSAHTDAGAAASLSDREATRGTETVLLAEDEPSVRRVTERMLHSLGYRVLVAADGEEAMRVADEWAGRIDVLLTDVVMPRVSGRELAARLRLAHPDLKVLFASGYTNTPFAFGEQTERTDFVQKPFTAQRLGQELRRLLDR
ncbi:MAG: hybrid sensor histidine kinase/response regulator [Anaerolineae bacterium]